jgi:hypothetical protein
MLSRFKRSSLAMLALLLVSGCVTMPTGPSVLVMPAPGKSIERFQGEDVACRQWAGQQTGISAQDTANQHTVSGAAAGTVIGAGAGALLGAASGNIGEGAAIGAGSGLLLGSASGANAGQAYGWEVQQRYDYAYVQCMYAKGNQIPGQVHRYRIRKAVSPQLLDRTSVPPDYVPAR